jgi:hypothetical protein
LECKLRIKKLELNEDEMSLNMCTDKKRPGNNREREQRERDVDIFLETILQEFRVKERAQKSKVENKLALTL